MIPLTRAAKVTLAASLLSLTGYAIYQTVGAYIILYGYLTHVSSWVHYVNFLGAAFWISLVGVNARFVGCLSGLVTLLLLWVKPLPFIKVKNLVGTALILESVYFVSIVPGALALLNSGSFLFVPSLGYGYFVQIFFTLPFLWLLAYQTLIYRQSTQVSTLLRFGALTLVGYTVALTANEISRWSSMISLQTIHFIQGIQAVGFYNALVLMPFSIVFAVVGVYRLFRSNQRSSLLWFGASLTVVGLNYCIYLMFTIIVGRLNTLPLVDIWTIPLFALGIALILNARKSFHE